MVRPEARDPDDRPLAPAQARREQPDGCRSRTAGGSLRSRARPSPDRPPCRRAGNGARRRRERAPGTPGRRRERAGRAGGVRCRARVCGPEFGVETGTLARSLRGRPRAAGWPDLARFARSFAALRHGSLPHLDETHRGCDSRSMPSRASAPPVRRPEHLSRLPALARRVVASGTERLVVRSPFDALPIGEVPRSTPADVAAAAATARAAQESWALVPFEERERDLPQAPRPPARPPGGDPRPDPARERQGARARPRRGDRRRARRALLRAQGAEAAGSPPRAAGWCRA